jgi:aldose 1-epimerase
MDLITLRAGDAAIELAPEAGGAVTRYWLERGALTREWLRPTPVGAARAGDPYEVAAFPLVPYSNRIRAGRFTFRDRAVAEPLNRLPERHAIHGHGWQARWTPLEVGATAARLEYRHAAGAWPWAYHATQRFTLTPSSLTVELEVSNRSATPMPAGLGWHPYFPRTPRATITAPVRAVWLTDEEMMPIDLVAPSRAADLERGVTAEAVALDNCFVGWSGSATIEWPELRARLVMRADPPLDCLVVYTPARRPFFCVEPVSHVTDAVNLAAAGRSDTGLLVLEPGGTLRTKVILAPEL